MKVSTTIHLIQDLLPRIFTRAIPIVDASASTLEAGSLLHTHQIDALCVIGEKISRKNFLAIGGYSVLSRLLKTDPNYYYDFLREPCLNVALSFDLLPAEEDLAELFRSFAKTRFGFACIKTKSGVRGLAALRDLVELYEKGILETDVTTQEVASAPVFSLSGDTMLNEVLREMFERRQRRVFISGTRRLVSDRIIISYVFSGEALHKVMDRPWKMLDATLNEVGGTEVQEVSRNISIRDASHLIMHEAEECFVCEGGIVTPWDIVMKPWEMGRLRIQDE